MMAEALFSMNFKCEIMSAAYYSIDDELLQHNLLDDFLLRHIIERAENPDKWEWSFDTGHLRIDILSKNEWKVEFFVSKSIPVLVSAKNLRMNPDKVSFH